ncbi:MAG: hypothetical protein HQ581_19065 [Planctomycetes bacterium]|nr:hypothetical protein [Planctomycetota bacterium]
MGNPERPGSASRIVRPVSARRVKTKKNEKGRTKKGNEKGVRTVFGVNSSDPFFVPARSYRGMIRYQLFGDCKPLPAARYEFPTWSGLFTWLKHDNRKQACRNLSIDVDDANVRIVITTLAEAFKYVSVPRLQSLLPRFAPCTPVLVVLETLCLTNEVQDALPAVKVTAEEAANDVEVLALFGTTDYRFHLVAKETRVAKTRGHVLNCRHERAATYRTDSAI